MFENVKGADKMKVLVREGKSLKNGFKGMSALLLELADGLLANIDEDGVFKRKFGSEAATKFQVLVERVNEGLKDKPFRIVLGGPDFDGSPEIIVKSLIVGGKVGHVCILLYPV